MTTSPRPDIEPAVVPAGRQIAYVTWRDGNQEIIVFDLDNPNADREQQALNLTRTPDVNETHPAWSHDGTRIAYTATVNGVEGVYYQRLDHPAASRADRARADARLGAERCSVLYLLDPRPPHADHRQVAGQLRRGDRCDCAARPRRRPDWTEAALRRASCRAAGCPPTRPSPTRPSWKTTPPQTTGLYGLGAAERRDRAAAAPVPAG